MNSPVYFPALWLVIAALVIGIMAILAALSYFRQTLGKDPLSRSQFHRQMVLLQQMRWVLSLLALAMTGTGLAAWYLETTQKTAADAEIRAGLQPQYDRSKIWEAPDPYLAETDEHAALIAYGRDLVARTQDYFGEKGLVRPGSINGMNCQNCHLDAGSKPYGNNYFAVNSTYPQMRPRSGSLETIPKRINDCFERSLNGQPLDTTGREMRAIVAYMQWLGTGIPKGEKPTGSGLAEVPFLDRPADPGKGQKIYAEKCASCHGADGQGMPIAADSPRDYPPLWGDKSYNEAAGLFRLSRFAAYVKANMPFGASYQNPQLSDEEAWDVAAFVNSQPRPKHPFLQTDWPKIEKKPYDHPFGPFADTFPEIQHKYGPFEPIVAYHKK
jgi:thiosulfate dehydrogenase